MSHNPSVRPQIDRMVDELCSEYAGGPMAAGMLCLSVSAAAVASKLHAGCFVARRNCDRF